ncbi:hypothetical protein MDA_GLEAN10017055 [Myotis davidii]|uniref:Uncharacterized protein n=1 Tax=Myotis davidii TaxID=225400 RepID=L5LH22_MYODS|nr:hypothetical protein MDA_GLEAN10017055 [Myotis davidii]
MAMASLKMALSPSPRLARHPSRNLHHEVGVASLKTAVSPSPKLARHPSGPPTLTRDTLQGKPAQPQARLMAASTVVVRKPIGDIIANPQKHINKQAVAVQEGEDIHQVSHAEELGEDNGLVMQHCCWNQ